jgi:hypothetical protein
MEVAVASNMVAVRLEEVPRDLLLPNSRTLNRRSVPHLSRHMLHSLTGRHLSQRIRRLSNKGHHLSQLIKRLSPVDLLKR